MTKNQIYDGVLFELEDASRLTLSPQIDNLFQESIQEASDNFREAVLRALIPVPNNRRKPRTVDIEDALDLEIEEIDERYLEKYVRKSSLKALNLARQVIHDKINLVINHPDYRKAVNSYRQQSQSETQRSSLYAFLEKNGFSHAEQVTPQTPLYHGLCMSADGSELDYNEQQELLSPEAYIGKLKSILIKGIQASHNAENLPCLESVFCVTNIKNAYGLIATKFSLSPEQKVWSRSGRLSSLSSEGYQIIAPTVNKPIIQNDFQVVIRSVKFFQDMKGAATKDIFGKITKEEHRDYVSQLVKLLKAEGIPYQMIDPDGTVRKPKINSAKTPNSRPSDASTS